MMKRLLVLLLLLPLLAGCMGPMRGGRAAAFDGLLAMAILADAAQSAPPEPEVVYVPVYPVPERPVPPSPPAATSAPPRVLFDGGAATDSVHELDLGACVARGVPAGYGHARLTFDPDGRVTAVAVDRPAGVRADGVQCLGQLLSRASAPRFDGSPATLGVRFEVRAPIL
jgi:hypothetical protein